MNAIIIAAGSGKRISHKIKNIPKALIQINKKPIIQYQINALKKMNISEIFVITGANNEKFNLKNVQYVNDKNYRKHDILGSLFEAQEYIKNDVLILYSDIIFEPKIISDVINSKSDIAIAVDMNWEEKYQNRSEHPKTEAENVLLDNRKNILQIKKNIQDEKDRIGEFLGILKLSGEGARIFVTKYNELMRRDVDNFHEAPSVLKAYITDMLQELIDLEINIEPVFISGKWCEIDTMQDLKNAEKIF
jgi:choline kinase